MKHSNTIDWAYASLTGTASIALSDAVGWVEVAGVVKAVVLSIAATVGSYAAKKLLQYLEPKAKNTIQKIKSFIKTKKQ